MKNITKMRIDKPVSEVFEAFVDPTEIGNFWFTSSSERWVPGKVITLIYEEYGAEGDIAVTEIEANHRIVFTWGSPEEEHVVTIKFIELDSIRTIVEVTEDGFKENDPELLDKMVDNKEGWVYMLTCLKGYLEVGANKLRAALVK
jgi:uncharacterized protein YndB with AHSA1/START domain